MTTTVDVEALVKDIHDQMEALGARVSTQTLETTIKGLIQEMLNDDPDLARKMRFGGPQEDGALVGTKYARFGLTVADVEFLYDLRQSIEGQKRVTGVGVYGKPSEELTRAFNAITSGLYLSEDEVRKLDKKAIDELFPRVPKRELNLIDRDILRRGGQWQDTTLYQRYIRAMDTAESGYGSQLIGAQYVGELWDAPRRLGRVFPLIETFEMTDPTAYLPVEADLPEMLFVAESTANNSSNYSTVKTGSNRVTVTAKKFVIHQMWSGEMEEDSIIPFIPFLRRQLAKAIAHYADSAVLNGDTTNAGTGNINLDDADPADTKHYLAFDGIRHAGLVDNTGNSADLAGPISLSALNAARGRMVDSTYLMDWGHPTDANDLVYLADPATADKMALLDEVLTVDKYGPKATVLNGELMRVLGHPVVSTIAMSKTEADGKVSTTGSNNTKGQIVTFNRRGFVAGWRRRVQLETERLPASDQTRLVASLRMGLGRFSPTGAASGIEAADVIYNISL